MYGQEELRWTPTYLLLDQVCPSRLKVVTQAVVDKIEFVADSENNSSSNSIGNSIGNGKNESTENDDELIASGVSLIIDQESFVARISPKIGSIALTSGALGNPSILQRSGCGPGNFLESMGIPVVIDNPSIGHGIDHEEVAVLYEWLDKWNTSSGDIPKGGAMGWPLVIFSQFLPELANLYSGDCIKSSYYQAHFGAGYAEPYTSFPSVVATPNCLRPDHSENGGYRLFIRSLDPSDTCILKQGDHRKDLETIAQGVYSMTNLFQRLVEDKIVGPQLQPPFPVTVENKERLVEWIKENHYTVFHWACTCQSGLHGRVADETFRLLRRPGIARPKSSSHYSQRSVIPNLFVGSAAALPELSENNPHLTISAFSVALAEELARTLANHNNRDYDRMRMLECTRAAHEVHTKWNTKNEQGLATEIRRAGEERPSLHSTAIDYHSAWEVLNQPQKEI